MAKSFRTLAGIPDLTASVTDSVLVIIDVQNEYANGLLTVSNLSTSRPAILELLRRYRAAGGHIAHIVHIVPDGAPVFTPNTKLAEEFEEIRPAAFTSTEVLIPKRFPGSFSETALDDFVKESGKKKVVLVGYMAHVCVSTTAREAHQRGYEVLICEDAIGTRDIPGVPAEQLRKTVLDELNDAFGTVIHSSAVQA